MMGRRSQPKRGRPSRTEIDFLTLIQFVAYGAIIGIAVGTAAAAAIIAVVYWALR